jgi:ribosomal protein S6--L-glutamate ligase
VRVLVVGGRAVAAMRRRARGNEFRSNFHRGGIVEPVDLTSEYVDIACRAARLLDLNIAGVDLLESKAGPLVLEVNSSPGLEGIERASGVNVAGAIIEHLMQNHAFSQVELDQLLRSKPNHGVLSLSVNRHPSLVGRQIGDMFQDPSEQVVFAIAREGMHVWRPRRTFVLRAGDELVCYGEFSRIRELLRPWMQEESETSAESSVDPFDEGRDEVPSW